MGCGIYLVSPAFYTDVTESYRLGRAGRIRTDIGGVYFNGLFVIGLALAYLRTGLALLVAVLYINLEIVQQLLPTLRFDGTTSCRPDRHPRPVQVHRPDPAQDAAAASRGRAADDLKRWPQIFVTVWVLTVIPLLVFQLGLITTQIPTLIATEWRMMRGLATAASSGAGPVELLVSGLQIFLLLLPVAGLVLILYSFGRQFVRWAVRYVNGPPADPEAARLNSA